MYVCVSQCGNHDSSSSRMLQAGYCAARLVKRVSMWGSQLSPGVTRGGLCRFTAAVAYLGVVWQSAKYDWQSTRNLFMSCEVTSRNLLITCVCRCTSHQAAPMSSPTAYHSKSPIRRNAGASIDMGTEYGCR